MAHHIIKDLRKRIDVGFFNMVFPSAKDNVQGCSMQNTNYNNNCNNKGLGTSTSQMIVKLHLLFYRCTCQQMEGKKNYKPKEEATPAFK